MILVLSFLSQVPPLSFSTLLTSCFFSCVCISILMLFWCWLFMNGKECFCRKTKIKQIVWVFMIFVNLMVCCCFSAFPTVLASAIWYLLIHWKFDSFTWLKTRFDLKCEELSALWFIVVGWKIKHGSDDIWADRESLSSGWNHKQSKLHKAYSAIKDRWDSRVGTDTWTGHNLLSHSLQEAP